MAEVKCRLPEAGWVDSRTAGFQCLHSKPDVLQRPTTQRTDSQDCGSTNCRRLLYRNSSVFESSNCTHSSSTSLRFTWRLSQQVPVALAPRLVCTPDFPFPSRARRQVHTCARALSLSHTHTNASFPKQMAAWGSAAESRLAQAREKVGSAHAHALLLTHTR